jgi:hypothetical protein
MPTEIRAARCGQRGEDNVEEDCHNCRSSRLNPKDAKNAGEQSRIRWREPGCGSPGIVKRGEKSMFFQQ